jgi:serine/threonine protein kinase
MSQPVVNEETVRLIMKGICLGLSHIHEKGITHRDMKMQNILIDLN